MLIFLSCKISWAVWRTFKQYQRLNSDNIYQQRNCVIDSSLISLRCNNSCQGNHLNSLFVIRILQTQALCWNAKFQCSANHKRKFLAYHTLSVIERIANSLDCTFVDQSLTLISLTNAEHLTVNTSWSVIGWLKIDSLGSNDVSVFFV
jgi:hypothetical protein